MENYVEQILSLIRNSNNDKEIKRKLALYHKSDIADALLLLDDNEKNRLIYILGKKDFSEVLTYFDEAEEYIEHVSYENAADLVELMDADDAVDMLQDLPKDDREVILSLMDDEARNEAKMILSFEDEQIGSKMTTNYIKILKSDTIKKAMRKLISQAHQNDNISTLIVLDESNKFYGVVDLKDLICARKDDDLNKLIKINYPYIYGYTKIDECINDIRDYDEDIIPILNGYDEVLGVITSNDITEVVDEELSDDFHKFASISEDNGLKEGVITSIKKRSPWLILLVFLGLVVSFLISSFEGIISTLPVMVFFQSLILDMAGNVGTQSLAVTVRALSSDISFKDKLKLIFREFRIGFLNGVLIGLIASIVCMSYLLVTQTIIHGDSFSFNDVFLASVIIGTSLICSMTISAVLSSFIPIMFKKMHIDPAVASGPLITTFNDIIAVICYYGLTFILFNAYIY